MFFLLSLFAALFRPGITTVKTNPDPIGGIEQAGGMIPNGANVQALAALQTNAAPAFGNWSQAAIPNSGVATYSAAQMVGGLIRRLSTGGTVLTDCTDTATNIILAIPGAKPLQTFRMEVANLNSSTGIALQAGVGVTLAGTNVIGGLQCRTFLGQVTGSATVTLTGCWATLLGSGL